jgi:uncharacterized membrane protein
MPKRCGESRVLVEKLSLIRFSILVLVLIIILAPNTLASHFAISGDKIVEVSVQTGAAEPEKYDLFLELRDVDSGELLSDVYVIVEVDGATGTKLDALDHVGEDGILKLRLTKDIWKVVLKVDELSTLGKDYYIESQIDLKKDTKETLHLFKLGSVIGYVYDDKNRAIAGADVKFECSTDYGITTPVKTDSYGSFVREWMPIGHCTVLAAFEDRVGKKDVEIRHGNVEEVEISLTGSLLQSSTFPTAFMLLFTLFGAIFYAYKKNFHTKVLSSVQSPTKEQEEPQEPPLLEKPEEPEVPQRAKDILETLNTSERNVVTFLIESGQETTQAKIYYSTGIPKTSLSRILQSLENKNVIITEKIGRRKKVELTDWFMEKE